MIHADEKQAVEEPTALVIRDWSINHENGHMRRRKSELPHVLLPTAHDGHRFRRLARMPRGAEIYAAWCLMLQVAAKCPTRGVLVDDRGVALTVEDLADMTGFPAELFEMAITALLDPRIGWLEKVSLKVLEEHREAKAKAAATAAADKAAQEWLNSSPFPVDDPHRKARHKKLKDEIRDLSAIIDRLNRQPAAVGFQKGQTAIRQE